MNDHDPERADTMTDAPTAAVLLIGNELLSGRTSDANLAYIARGLTAKGILLAEARVVPDIASVIVDSINTLRQQHTYVFTTGGIGPTHDDITADCVAAAFGVELPVDERARTLLLEYFEQRGVEANADRMRMARIPAGAELIENPVSVAPGFRLQNLYVLAGVPRIMQAMFDNVLPTLRGGPAIYSLTLVCNLAEGTIASDLRQLQLRHPDLDIGSYPGNYSSDSQQALTGVEFGQQDDLSSSAPGTNEYTGLQTPASVSVARSKGNERLLSLVVKGTNKEHVAKAGNAINQLINKHDGTLVKSVSEP